MKILRVHLERPEARVIAQTTSVIQRGGIIAVPTDTCYGLSADVYNQRAVQRVFDIKQRYYRKPISIMVSDVEMLRPIAEINATVEKLVKKYLPGSLTIVVPALSGVTFQPGVITETIGFRIPDSPVNLAIVESYGKPLTTTSANISGQDNSYSLQDVLGQFEGKRFQPDLILDGGDLSQKKPSTVIQVKGDDIILLRQGDLVVEEAQSE